MISRNLLLFASIFIPHLASSQTKAEMDASWKKIHTPVVDFSMPQKGFEKERVASTAPDIAVYFHDGEIDSATYYFCRGATTNFQLNVTRGRVNPVTTDSLIRVAIASTNELMGEPFLKSSHFINKKVNGVTSFQIRYTSIDDPAQEEQLNLVTTMGIQVYKQYVVMYSATGSDRNLLAELEYFISHLKFRKAP